MASVKIDLGFGEQAILSERAVSGIATVTQKLDAEEFLRRWPRTRSIHQERSYLQQLGLHVGYNPPGVNPSDASAVLRSAVKSGRVMVVIERATARFGGGGGVPQSTARSGAIVSSRQSFAEMVVGESGTSATLSDAISAPKSYSWMQHYDDVSADDLIKYLESVISGTSGGAAASDADSSTPLGDTTPFEYGEDSPVGDLPQEAGTFLAPEEEAECEMQLNADMDECSAWYAAKPSSWGMCRERAMQRYANCLKGLA